MLPLPAETEDLGTEPVHEGVFQNVVWIRNIHIMCAEGCRYSKYS